MRIALVTEDWFSPGCDTTAMTTLKAVAHRLIDLGHVVRIVAPGPGQTRYRTSTVVRVSPLAKPGAQVRQALTAFGPDLVHVTDPGRLGRKALQHARATDVRTLVVQQSPVEDVEEWAARVLGSTDDLVVTTAWVQRDLARHGVPADVWRPGVDSNAFTPALRDPWLHGRWGRDGRVVVGYAGPLTRSRDVRDLAALAQLPGIRPVLIGDGPQRRWLADRLPGVRMTGPLGTGDLAVALASLDVFVAPHRLGTCCHELRAAAASGVPVVAPRSGGAAEVVRGLEDGVLYDPASPTGLVEAVASLVADPQRALLGERGRAHALERDWTAAVDELVAGHCWGPSHRAR